MIARVWMGWATPENADVYQGVVSKKVLPAIAERRLEGYHGAYLLRREVNDGEVEFATIMMFDSIDSIRAFTGEDYEVAHVPAEARAVLTRFDQRAVHYETLLTPEDTRKPRQEQEQDAERGGERIT
jgi:heme-degrading monooxygenase HmoA